MKGKDLFAGEVLGAIEGEVGIGGALHDEAGEGDGVLDCRYAGDCAATAA